MKFPLSSIFTYLGIIIGIIAALTLISRHPINILILGISAAIYFAGVKIAKKGK